MPSLSPETQEQLRAQSRKISVAHDLDPELQEELYGHMEDKALAYLSGQEPVTESDALILVREHFGDAKVIKELMGDVHAQAAGVSLLRKTGAIIAAIMVVGIVKSPFTAIFTVLGIGSFGWDETRIYFAISVLADAVGIGLLWLIVNRWQRQILSGNRLWFQYWNPLSLMCLLLGLLFLRQLAPEVGFLHQPNPYSQATDRIVTPSVSIYLYTPMFFRVLSCMIWLWWMDVKPRSNRAIIWGLTGWFLYVSIFKNISLILPHAVLTFGCGQVSHFSFPDVGSLYNIGNIVSYMLTSYQASRLLYSSLYSLGIGAVAITLYVIAQYVHRMHNQKMG